MLRVDQGEMKAWVSAVKRSGWLLKQSEMDDLRKGCFWRGFFFADFKKLIYFSHD